MGENGRYVPLPFEEDHGRSVPLPRIPGGRTAASIAIAISEARFAHTRFETQRSALYATVVADRYARLVESSEPADAMREAVGQAEEVVKVWEGVVNEK